jgi:hypothetical protein
MRAKCPATDSKENIMIRSPVQYTVWLACISMSVLLMHSAQAANKQFLAETEAASALRQGQVLVGDDAWVCNGNRCTVSAGWLNPRQRDCKGLAMVVGRIRYYGLQDRSKSLSPDKLRRCNFRAATAASPAARPTPAATSDTDQSALAAKMQSRGLLPETDANIKGPSPADQPRGFSTLPLTATAEDITKPSEERFNQAREHLSGGDVIIAGGRLEAHFR